MKYNEFKIVEKRRNPELNQKETESSIIARIDSYSKNSFLYLSYTDIDKIGINPMSSYNTPIGIYSYPLTNDIMTSIKADGLVGGVPFAGNAPYIWLISAKDSAKGLVVDEYRKGALEADRKKLFDYVSSQNDSVTQDVFDKIIQNSVSDARVHSPAGYIWNLTRILAELLVNPQKFNAYRSENKISVGDQVVLLSDKNVILTVLNIYNNYGMQDMTYEVIDVIGEEGDEFEVRDNEVKLHKKKVEPVAAVANDPAEEAKLKFKIGDLARISNPNAKTPRWTVTGIEIEGDVIRLRNNDGVLAKKSFNSFYKANPEYAPDTNESTVLENTPNKNPAVVWSLLLNRVLGYNFVDDYAGDGLIHPNEPIQTVFFQRSYVEVVEKIISPTSSRNPYKVDQENAKINRKNKQTAQQQKLVKQQADMAFDPVNLLSKNYNPEIVSKFINIIEVAKKNNNQMTYAAFADFISVFPDNTEAGDIMIYVQSKGIEVVPN
jgi:ribosomal protein S17